MNSEQILFEQAALTDVTKGWMKISIDRNSNLNWICRSSFLLVAVFRLDTFL